MEKSLIFGASNDTAFGSTATSLAGTVLPPVPTRGRDAHAHLARHAKEYTWYASKNRDDAQRYLHGITIAGEYQLEWQVQLYAQHLSDLVTKDAAEQTLHLVKQNLRHRGSSYVHPAERALPTHQFRVPIPDSYAFERYEWVYYPIAEFGNLIPPQALEALTFVEQYSVSAQAYWVADKLKVLPTQRVSVDPLLYAQYGRWFVSIAQWL